MRWGLFRRGECLDRFAEVYLVPSWDEHLAQVAAEVHALGPSAADAWIWTTTVWGVASTICSTHWCRSHSGDDSTSRLVSARRSSRSAV
ncbi:hypothetical protein OG994_21720 [Micromonospora globbae]|uniref:Uncharacterized protein n=1 Tax=Micromonospora globbae TaxID=1894969 RepID=A0ABZ1SG71_9ACTN|nr:hypothetical protein OH732_04645 [Micromonospora globbae]